MRLLTRLLLYILTPFLIGSAIVLTLVGHQIEAILQDDINVAAESALRLQVHAVEELLTSHRHALQVLSASEVLTEGDITSIRNQLAAWQGRAGNAEGLYFITPDGMAYGATGLSFSVADRPYFERIKRGEPVITVLVSRATGNPIVLFLEPVKGADGRQIGTIGASLLVDRIVESVSARKPTASAKVVMTNANGDPLRRSGKANDGLPEEEARRLAAAVSAAGGQSVTFASASGEERRLVFQARIPTLDWHLFLAYPESEIQANLARAWRMGILIILALALGAIVAVGIFNRWLLRPIGRLAQALARLEHGELEARIVNAGSDELGQLASAFNRMASQLDGALQSARAAKQKFRTLFENASDAIFLIRDQRFAACNPFTERMFHCTQAQLLATGPIDLSPEMQPDGRTSREAGEAYAAAALAGEPQYFSWTHVTAEGHPFDAEVCLSRIELDGVTMLQAIVRDISARTEAKAREAALETKFRRVFEASPDSMVIAEVESGRILDINEGFERLTGYSRAEAVGKTVGEINLSALREERSALRTQLREGGVIQGFSGELRRRDGSLRHVSLSAAPFMYNGVQCYVSITRDITDERLIQKALEASEARMKTIFDAAPMPIAINRVKDFAYLAVNPAHERVFGHTAESIIGKSIREAGIVFLSDNALRAQTRKLLTYGEIDNAGATAISKSGKHVHFIYSSRVIELDGEPVIISLSTDISRQKEVEDGLRETEEALRESEARFIALFQSSPAALGVFDDGRRGYSALQLNEAWFNTFRYPPEEVIGKPSHQFGLWLHPAEREEFMTRITRDGEVREFEGWLKRHGGEAILCAISGRLVTVGQHRLLLAAYIDVTQQHQAEETLRNFNLTLETRIQERTSELQRAQSELMRSEKLAALGSLVAGVAHELNTPIGTCLTVASTLVDHTATIRKALSSGLRRSELDNYLADAASGTGILARNLQRAAELIQSFKSVAVDQSNDQKRNFDLRKVVGEILAALRPSLRKHAHEVRIEIDEGLSMNSYPGPLEQVVVNLVNNAIFHGLEERENGSVLIRATPLGEDRIRLTIADNGKGIPAANLSRVFDPFFTTKLGTGGSGLGLHIVRNIVEDVLGGRIHAESEVDRGTTMIVEMPRIAPH